MNGYHEYSAQNTGVLISYWASYYAPMKGLSCPSRFPHVVPLTPSPKLLPSTVPLLFSTCNAIPLCS